MRQLEGFLGVIAGLLFAGTGVLAAVWIGLSVNMIINGAPNSTRAQLVQVADQVADQVTEATVETASSEATATAGASETAAAEPAAPAVSADAGAKVFKKCKACHVAEADGKNKTGPNLWNLVGRQIAAVEGFKYSDAMAAKAGETWSVQELQTYLVNPKKRVPGTSMTFAGLKKPADIDNLIVFLAQQADSPQDAAALGFASTATAAAADAPAEDTAEEVVEIDPVPYPEGITYRNAPERSAEAQAEIDSRVAALADLAPTLDYERARFHPIHFPPMIEQASNEECLVCHQEIMEREPLEASPAGVPATQTIAWYQTLDTYAGDQESFHYRHLQSDYAREVMKLDCNFCHKGNDPREESPDMMPTRAALSAAPSPEFTLRKMVNPSETCLRCHGAFPDPEIMGLEGKWHEVRADMEYPEAPNGCLSCHAESFRTVRHGVTYLNAENIERIAREGSSDSCYGCHGGRAWYRISYPYPRHAWPDMDEELPDWAAGRATASDPAYALPASE